MTQNTMQKPKEIKDQTRFVAQGEAVDGRWEVTRVLGEGGFGAVYAVRDKKNPGAEEYAMKVESATADAHEQVLKMDVNILKRMRKQESKHFAKLISVGKTTKFNYTVTTLLGSNLQDLKRRFHGKLKPRTVAHVAKGCLEAVRDLHAINYLHRDLKPPNLAIGVPPNGLRDVFVLDFGLARQYSHDDDKRLRRPRERAGFRGTKRYTPIACHRHEETARADDLWSWLYVMIELTVRRLAWDSVLRESRKEPLKVQIKKVGAVKEEMNSQPAELLHGCPMEFMELHEHLCSLDYYSDPNYDLMLTALSRLEERRRRPNKDGEMLDWEENEQSQVKSQPKGPSSMR